MKKKSIRQTKAQKQAANHLELEGIVHFLLTEQRCPVIFAGQLAYVRCPGVCEEAFKQAIDKRAARILLAWLDKNVPKIPLHTP